MVERCSILDSTWALGFKAGVKVQVSDFKASNSLGCVSGLVLASCKVAIKTWIKAWS